MPQTCQPALRLAETFGSEINPDMVKVDPDIRSGLILMLGKLFINALKYGYPGTTTRTIGVVVENTGAGLLQTIRNGGIDHNGYC